MLSLLPYSMDPLLVRNGFPLKALEMCAAGLPVISSELRPLEGLVSALQVTKSKEEFVRALSRISRQSLSAEQRQELRQVAADNDYDLKFAGVVRMVKEWELPRDVPWPTVDVESMPNSTCAIIILESDGGWLGRFCYRFFCSPQGATRT
jgi:hypothetical protein